MAKTNQKLFMPIPEEKRFHFVIQVQSNEWSRKKKRQQKSETLQLEPNSLKPSIFDKKTLQIRNSAVRRPSWQFCFSKSCRFGRIGKKGNTDYDFPPPFTHKFEETENINLMFVIAAHLEAASSSVAGIHHVEAFSPFSLTCRGAAASHPKYPSPSPSVGGESDVIYPSIRWQRNGLDLTMDASVPPEK